MIHCASGSPEVIIQGTANMLDAAQKIGVKRFVHLSTAEVYGNPRGEIDENFPFQYTGNAYGDSKIEAEKLCWKYSAEGLPITIIRPSIVYGPFSKEWTIRFAQSLQSGNWGIFKGYGEGTCNIVYISDLVEGILMAIQNEQATGQAFNFNGPDLVTWNQYLQGFNSALGFSKLRIINPASAKIRASIMTPIRTSAKFVLYHFKSPLQKISQRYKHAKKLMKSVEKSLKTTPRLEELGLFNRKAVYLKTKAEHLLGYKPKYDLDKGLELSVKWLEHIGLINSKS